MVRTLKKRYIGFTTTVSKPMTRTEIWRLLVTELSKSPIPRSRVRLIEYQMDSGLGILFCAHNLVDEMRRLFETINTKQSGTIEVRVLGVSGTLRALRQKFLTKQQ